jgi:hypothetical protein
MIRLVMISLRTWSVFDIICVKQAVLLHDLSRDVICTSIAMNYYAEVDKVTLKSNGDEALSDESL